MAEFMAGSIVARRLVYHVGGYDPMPPEAVHRRFVREIHQFEGTWSLSAAVSPPEIGADEAVWNIDTTGPNWRVDTRFHFVRWDDVMASTSRRPLWWRIFFGLVAVLDFAAQGALWGYIRTSWRYAIFFLYPLLVFMALLAIAWTAGAFAATASASRLIGAAAGAGAFVALLFGTGRWLYLFELFDDWIFSRAYVWHGNQVLEQRFNAIAREICAAARSGDADEILVLGHSLGAVLAVDLLDRAIKLDPALGSNGTRVALVSVGSSILKIGLHRRAERFRAALARVASAPRIFWAEYQALTDPMNFYSTDPVAELGLLPTGRPVVRRVWFKQMLDTPAYRRIRRNFFRLHNQFVSGNTRRATYDYFMLLCGPLSVTYQILLPDGFISAFGESERAGSGVEPAPAR